MKIGSGTVVRFEYALSADGKVVDRTPEGETQTILVGHAHGLPPGLETLLHGREAGESFSATLEPESGYGAYDPAKRHEVSRADFPPGAPLELGSGFYAEDEAGRPVSFRVVGVEGERVTVDANPVLAGQPLEYAVTVHAVRVAEPDELEHGHVHGSGGVAHGH